MRTKQFKAESKKLLDMMINSIYTHKEIFLRELISNASDAMDKLYFRSMQENLALNRNDLTIKITPYKEGRILTIEDNGIGMTAEELETNLGTIAKSGSLDFKNGNEKQDETLWRFHTSEAYILRRCDQRPELYGGGKGKAARSGKENGIA